MKVGTTDRYFADTLGELRKPWLAPRHEDFQSSCRTETMCTYRSLLVSIQAFNGGLSRSILPIRTHSDI